MWRFAGLINYRCTNCSGDGSVDIDEFEVDWVGSDERQMGPELTYELCLDTNCMICSSDLNFKFTAYEYPVEVLNYVESDIEGAVTTDQPYMEYLPELYEAQDFDLAYATASEIIREIQLNPQLLRNISSRQFEEVIAELFRSRGFQVELTKRTRDGGKDIIAISTDRLGIKLKYFVECKHYAETNKVGVEVVRALHGVKNTKDGPNKTIIATTSSFTADAMDFAVHEATSSWDVTLADYNQIMSWVGGYGRQS